MSVDWLTEEQRQVRDVLRRAVSGRTSIDDLTQLGIYGAPIAEVHGGASAGTAAALLLADALGRARSRVPFIENVVLVGTLIDRLGTQAQKDLLLPRIADGTLRVALALLDAGSDDPLEPAAFAVADGDAARLSGIKAPVVHAAESDLILVSVRCDDGLSLYLLEPSDVAMSGAYQMIDGDPAATIDLDGVIAADACLLGVAGGALDALTEAIYRSLAVQAAEVTGIMAHLIEASIAYLNDRAQFGQPLANFQVLRHRVAEMILRHEQAESLVTKLRLASEVPGATINRRSAMAAALVSARAGRFVGQEAVQLHGGMGLTEEMSVGPALKRIYVTETRFGSVERHAFRYGKEVYL